MLLFLRGRPEPTYCRFVELLLGGRVVLHNPVYVVCINDYVYSERRWAEVPLPEHGSCLGNEVVQLCVSLRYQQCSK